MTSEPRKRPSDLIVGDMEFFTNVGIAGAVHFGQLPGSIGVLESPDNRMPIGMASEVGRTERGLAEWRLRVHGADVPGRWVIIDRRFVPVENASAGSCSG